jgi:glycine cleavage system H lipoate-binding protein
MSSLIAKKLEKIIKIDFYDEHKSEHNLILNEIFCYIKSEDYEIDLFSPLDGNILEINPVFETITIEKPIILTTESIYNENWLLKIKSDKDVSNQTKNWIYPEDKKFSKLVNMIIKGDRVLNERCCPNLLDTKVVRRLEKKNNL